MLRSLLDPAAKERLAQLSSYVVASGEVLWFGAWVLTLALLLLMGLGLAVQSLASLAGAPLPAVDDDPNRVEVPGLLMVLWSAPGFVDT